MIRFATAALVLTFTTIELSLAADSVFKAVPVPTEFAVLGQEKLARIELLAEVDGTPVSEIWNESFTKLHRYFDRNSDGKLDAKEAELLPSTRSLRQAMSIGLTPPVGAAPAFAQLDNDKDGQISNTELAAFYRANGVGNVLIGVGRLSVSAELTSELVKILDADGDGKLSAADWKNAAASLGKLDKNSDELIGAGELVPKTIYPGAAGTVLLTPPSKNLDLTSVIADLPLVLLPTDATDSYWTTALTKRNRAWNAADLSAWRKNPAVARWVVKFQSKPKTTSTDVAKSETDAKFEFTHDGIRIEGWIAEGKVGETFESARASLLARLDAPDEASEEKGSRRRGGGLAWLVPIADKNGDGQLERAELEAWLELQTQIASGQVLLTVLDNAGLFEFLDTNHDGALSNRELQTAWARLKGAGFVSKGAFDPKLLPRSLLVAASQGYPQTLAIEPHAGPAWFRAMDKNGDGDVSQKEFTGPAEVFNKLDNDQDGLLNAIEAKAVGSNN